MFLYNKIRIANVVALFVASSILFGINYSYGQNNQQTKVVFDNIEVNGISTDINSPGDLVFADTDSITFYYHCNVGNSEKKPFLFRIMLKTESDSSIRSVGSPVAMYRNLREDDYQFTVYAFDLERKWKTNPISIRFSVDNRETELGKKIELLSKNQISKDSLINFYRQEHPATFGPFDLYTFGLAVGSGLAFSLVFAFAFSRSKHKKMKKILKDIKDKTMKDNSNTDADRIIVENGKLKAELSALRGQIDAMNARGVDLATKNSELEDSVAKLSKSKKELEELQDQKDDLFAIVIHDIKNPANLIKSLVELLRSYDLTASEQQEVIDDIVETTSQIVILSQEVSRILALEGGSMKLFIEKNNLNEIVKDVFQRNKIAAENKKISFLLDLPDELPSAQFDAQKIGEVIDNLVSNAIKFTPKNGAVRIKSSQVEDSIVIEVSDNGLGLSEDDVKQAFRRGSKLSARPTAGESSTGLGLWIVKKLVEAHDGKVWVRSAVGMGSTFAFSIPIKRNGHSPKLVDMNVE